jgi:hypothetical protein
MKRRVAIPCLLLASCASQGRFPLREPIWRDTDLDSHAVPCRVDKGSDRPICRPSEYVSSLAWDGADNVAFRPVARFFAVDPGGEAVNVNSMDEVPDSSWFENRIGRRPMSPADVARGACGEDVIDGDAPDGSILIDAGKPNGGNPGFRVQLPDGRRYMFKSDLAPQFERTTAAAAIATRLYHAAGWYVPCETVIYVRRSTLRLKPGITSTDNFGATRPFDEAVLDKLLGQAARSGDRYRFVASRWLPGRLLGPFTYAGTKDDDPGDVIPHEDRRDLRGAKLLAAWTDHYDSREENSMSAWLADNPRHPDSSPGIVRHYYLDLGDCFGTQFPDEMWRRIGHAYYFDIGYILEDLLSFGAIGRPWDRAQLYPGGIFGYYSARDFDPEAWRGGYPNPAFGRMTESDGAWAARIIARFSDAHLTAIVAAGKLTRPEDAAFLVAQLSGRRDTILRRYFKRLSPVTDLAAEGRELCGVDLARKSGVFPASRFSYRARVQGGATLPVRALPDGRVCTTVPADAVTASDGHASRYRVVDLQNGQAPGVLHVHLFDLGTAGGLRIAGIEREEG